MLRGDASVGDMVLRSNQESNLFLYLVSNGAPGLVQMPGDQFLFADDLKQTIEFMSDN
jgi:glycosylphosphatidylinositol transamidase (GPIT) subunit GPI8